MPIYTWVCDSCGTSIDDYVLYSKRNDPRPGCSCGGVFKRDLIYMASVGKPKHQMAVVLGNGKKVEGDFGGGYRLDHSKTKNKKR